MNATKEKKEYENSKWKHQIQMGFRIQGIKTYKKEGNDSNDDECMIWDKQYGRKLKLDLIMDPFLHFLGGSSLQVVQWRVYHQLVHQVIVPSFYITIIIYFIDIIFK